MSWTVVRHSAKQFSTDTDDDLARVWQVENGVGETAWIEVSVSGQARMTLLGPGYRSAIHEALKSKGESEVLRVIDGLPDATRPPWSVRLSSDGRHTGS
jgi:hypothetical protein